MKRHETQINEIAADAVNGAAGQTSTMSQNHVASFAKVLDGRKCPVRGLWKRGDRFYAQLTLENPFTGEKKTKRVMLADKNNRPVATVAQAVAELKRLQVKRTDGSPQIVKRTDKFSDYATEYLKTIASGEGAKKPSTVEKEKTILGRWSPEIGHLRLNQIRRVHVNRFIEKRQAGGAKNRTINLDLWVFRQVMKRAMSDELILQLPTHGMKDLKETPVKRSLFTTAELEKLCKAAFETKQGKDGKTMPLTENAQQFVDYVRLMAYCGARRNEALGIMWKDVDFDKGLLYIRRQITRRGIETVKNGEEHAVQFTTKLRAHLEDMKERSGDVSEWLFPSSQRGEKDIPAKDFRESLKLVRQRAEMPNFNFHDCRHHFCSMCVMSGVDYASIAKWLNHKDGGKLVGEVYGHLSDEHLQSMAARVNFEPRIVAAAA